MRPRKNQSLQAKLAATDSPFKKLRLEVKLSQEQLSREIGVAVSSVRRWEKGAEPTLTIEQMKEFCRAVKVSFADLPNKLGYKNNS